MAIGSPGKTARLDQLRIYAVVQVRAGYATAEQVRRDVSDAVREEITDPQEATAYADALIERAEEELAADAERWPALTTYDRFQEALDELRAHDIVVLEAAEDHWSADAELRRRRDDGRQPRGIAYFTPADVWHAVEHEMLELNVWHGSAANVREGDELITLVQSLFARHGISTRFDEGRLEVSITWQRRPAG